MRMGFKDHFVTRLQVEAAGDDRISLRGIAHETDLFGSHPKKLRRHFSRRLMHRMPGLDLQIQIRGDLIIFFEDGPRGRAKPTAIQIRKVAMARIEIPHAIPKWRRILRLKGQQATGPIRGRRARCVHHRGGRRPERRDAQSLQEVLSAKSHKSENVRV